MFCELYHLMVWDNFSTWHLGTDILSPWTFWHYYILTLFWHRDVMVCTGIFQHRDFSAWWTLWHGDLGALVYFDTTTFRSLVCFGTRTFWHWDILSWGHFDTLDVSAPGHYVRWTSWPKCPRYIPVPELPILPWIKRRSRSCLLAQCSFVIFRHCDHSRCAAAEVDTLCKERKYSST